MTKYEQYIEDTQSGKIIVGKYCLLAVQRHVNDLKRPEFYFDKKAADTAILMIECMRITEGLMNLSDFQAFIVSQIFGWKLTKNNLRKYRYSYLEMARKTGKTTLVEAIAIVFYLSEPKAEIYNAATKRDQAKYGFLIAQDIVRNTPLLADRIKIHQNVMLYGSSRFEPLSAEAKRLDGLNPLVNIIDEFHEHPNDKLYNVLKSGMGARKQPHQMVITTAGFNKESACFNLRKTCTEILEGIKEDDSMFVMIFSLDDNDDWENPDNWIKANPNLGVTVDMDFLLQEYKQAKNNGGSEIVNFKTKNLNIWCDAPKVWIPNEVWVKNTHGLKISDLLGKTCYGGLDCAKSVDLNAFCLIFPDQFERNGNEIIPILPFFWIPDDKIKNNKDRVDYRKWVDQGHMFEFKDSNIVDYNIIEQDILQQIMKYDFRGGDFDHVYAGNVVSNLALKGIEWAPLGQSHGPLTSATQEVERLATGQLFEHFGNPVMRWMIGNVVLNMNAKGYVMPDKAKSQNKIDGVSALVNAVTRWRRLKSTPMDLSFTSLK